MNCVHPTVAGEVVGVLWESLSARKVTAVQSSEDSRQSGAWLYDNYSRVIFGRLSDNACRTHYPYKHERSGFP